MWESTFKSAKAKYGEEKAARIAWSAVKKRFKKMENKWVARNSDFELFTTVEYSFTPDNTTITRSNDGYVYVKQPLASTRSIDGISFSPVALKRGMEQINLEKVKGRLDAKHKLMEMYHRMKLSPEEIEAKLQEVEDDIVAEQAFIEGDKLVANLKIKASVFDKIKNYKAASIEARFPSESLRAGVTDQMRITGFVLTDEPADISAVRA